MGKLLITVFNCLIVTNILANSNSLQWERSITNSLYKVLDFIEHRFDEIHFDGLFGLTFANAFLSKLVEVSLPYHTIKNSNILINKCVTIHSKIFPLLPDHPKYMITFRNNLLDARKWKNSLPNDFAFRRIRYLGYYNWTADIIINNKNASYKGVKSDVCLREILELSQPNKSCYVSGICEEMMLDENRIDTSYLLTHRLLYLQIIRQHGCMLSNKYQHMDNYIATFCSYIYKEVLTSDRLNFPHYDIFIEQIVLCGMEGFAEFLNTKWLNRIIEWQIPYGCYKNMRQYISKRTSFTIDFGCSDHTTGLGAAALALHLRYLYS